MKLKFSFYFLIQILLIFCINNNKSDNKEFKGIYSIYSLSNNNCLTNKYYALQFFNKYDKKYDKKCLLFRIFKNKKNLYVIESRKLHIKLGANDNGHIFMVYNPRKKSFKGKNEWNIIKIEENQYVVQNNGNQQYLEIKNNFVQCINDLPYPIEEHKSQIGNNFRFNFLKIYEEVEIKPEHEEIIKNEPIDILIKYIDLTDKALNRTGIKQIQKDEDNEELRYSIRSILQYIPWIRKIFILMPNEKVKYFKPYEEIKQKIIYIKDKDVLGYDSANIYAFTFNLFRLEKFGLSNNFIYIDDDFFFGKNLRKSNFFYYEENEKRVVPSLLNDEFPQLVKEKKISFYNLLYQKKDSFPTQGYKAWLLSLASTEKFFLEYYQNLTLFNPTPTHNAIPYNIQDLKEIYDLILFNYKYANETLNSIERHILTLQTQHFVDLYALNIKHRKVHSIDFKIIPMKSINTKYLYKSLFVINTGGDENYTEKDYIYEKEILKIRFPHPTQYEIFDFNLTKENKIIDLKEDNNTNIRKNSMKSNDENQLINPNEKNKKIINDFNYDISNAFQLKNKTLVEINMKQAIKLKICYGLIILICLLNLCIFYFYYFERNKNRSRYYHINYYEIKNAIQLSEEKENIK